MNTSAPFMSDYSQSQIVEKQRAELYMRIYQYAAQDFITTADFRTFMISLDTYLTQVEGQLANIMSAISAHTHIVPPHGNCPSTVTAPPGTSFSWTDINNPEYQNTTLTTPNIGGNYVTLSTGSEGDLTPEMRRFLPLPLTLKPTVPPVLDLGNFIL